MKKQQTLLAVKKLKPKGNMFSLLLTKQKNIAKEKTSMKKWRKRASY